MRLAASERGARTKRMTRFTETAWAGKRGRKKPRKGHTSALGGTVMGWKRREAGEVFCSADAGDSWRKLDREFSEIRTVAWTPNS